MYGLMKFIISVMLMLTIYRTYMKKVDCGEKMPTIMLIWMLEVG